VGTSHACKRSSMPIFRPRTWVPQRLHAAQRYAVLGGGKRLRPLLVYCTGEALNIPATVLDAPAAAVEPFIPTRWSTTICLRWTTMICVADNPRLTAPSTRQPPSLPGTRCKCWLFHALARSNTGRDFGCTAEMIQILADASGTAGMAGGQAIDLAASDAP